LANQILRSQGISLGIFGFWLCHRICHWISEDKFKTPHRKIFSLNFSWLTERLVVTVQAKWEVRAVSDNNEVGNGQIAAPCTFRHEGRKPAIRCNLHQGPVSGVNSPIGIPTPSLLTVLNCHWCRTSLRSDTSPR
jgi:hypothetical protein